MPTYTPNYHLAKPLVNSAVDQDLWGSELNTNMTTIDTTLKSLQDQITAISGGGTLPIGSYYFNETDSTNPATLLGYGTWVAVTDKFIVARGSTYTSTGGAATVTISASNLPSFSATVYNGVVSNSSSGPVSSSVNHAGYTPDSITINAGSPNTAISTIPPYQAAYCWKRTA